MLDVTKYDQVQNVAKQMEATLGDKGKFGTRKVCSVSEHIQGRS